MCAWLTDNWWKKAIKVIMIDSVCNNTYSRVFAIMKDECKTAIGARDVMAGIFDSNEENKTLANKLFHSSTNDMMLFREYVSSVRKEYIPSCCSVIPEVFSVKTADRRSAMTLNKLALKCTQMAMALRVDTEYIVSFRTRDDSETSLHDSKVSTSGIKGYQLNIVAAAAKYSLLKDDLGFFYRFLACMIESGLQFKHDCNDGATRPRIGDTKNQWTYTCTNVGCGSIGTSGSNQGAIGVTNTVTKLIDAQEYEKALRILDAFNTKEGSCHLLPQEMDRNLSDFPTRIPDLSPYEQSGINLQQSWTSNQVE